MLIPGHLYAQRDSVRSFKNILLPAFSYAPETSVAAGAMDIALFRTGKTSRLSQASVTGLYTFKNQFMGEVSGQFYFAGDRYLVTGDFVVEKFPEYFYGIGNNTPAYGRQTITYRASKNSLVFARRVTGTWYAGLRFDYLDYYAVQSSDKYMDIDLTGWRGGKTMGIGVEIVSDSRDHFFNPRRGAYWQLAAVFNGSALGGVYHYNSFDLDGRRYIPLDKKTVLAMQGVGMIKLGEVPFLQLSYLGGSDMLRGIYAGRYRDKDLAAAQAEIRRQLVGKWGIVAFCGAGKVFPDLSAADWTDLRWSYGVGVRRGLGKNGRLNVRLDAGISGGVMNVYAGVGEAF